MFGDKDLQGSELGLRRFRERQEAQKTWPFLTQSDLSSIHTEAQLCAIVAARTGRSATEVAPGVRVWMTGHFLRLGTSNGLEGQLTIIRPDW